MPHASVNDPTVDVSVNDGKLSHFGLLQPSYPDEPIEILRERYQKDNYLFLKGLLPREHALKARDAYFKFLEPSKVLKPNTAHADGIFDDRNSLSNFPGLSSRTADVNTERTEQATTFVDLTHRAHTQPFYKDDFCQHPNLIKFVGQLTAWSDVRQFGRSLLRCNLPHADPVGVHYDQIFLREGDVTNLTAWCAMGDIKLNGGGLMYLEESKYLFQPRWNEPWD